MPSETNLAVEPPWSAPARLSSAPHFWTSSWWQGTPSVPRPSPGGRSGPQNHCPPPAPPHLTHHPVGLVLGGPDPSSQSCHSNWRAWNSGNRLDCKLFNIKSTCLGLGFPWTFFLCNRLVTSTSVNKLKKWYARRKDLLLSYALALEMPKWPCLKVKTYFKSKAIFLSSTRL